MSPGESLCREIDGFGGPIGHADFFRPDVQGVGQEPLCRLRCRFRIGAYVVPAMAQMIEKFFKPCGMVYVAAEIEPDGMVVKGEVVSVSVNHESFFCAKL